MSNQFLSENVSLGARALVVEVSLLLPLVTLMVCRSVLDFCSRHPVLPVICSLQTRVSALRTIRQT